MLVIAFTGKKGSGKDEACIYLNSKYGFKHLDYTKDVIAPMLLEQGKEVTRDIQVELVGKIRKEKGIDIFAKMLSEKINSNSAIAGTRYPEEVEYFRKKFGKNFKLIAIEVDDKIRWQRCVQRGTKGEAKNSFEEFMERENLPTEKVIPEAMKLADFTVTNNSDKKGLFLQLDKILKQLNL